MHGWKDFTNFPYEIHECCARLLHWDDDYKTTVNFIQPPGGTIEYTNAATPPGWKFLSSSLTYQHGTYSWLSAIRGAYERGHFE